LWRDVRAAPGEPRAAELVLEVVKPVMAATLERLYPGVAAQALSRRVTPVPD
jgi:hypothetical protein